jgi:hypothetical protein
MVADISGMRRGSESPPRRRTSSHVGQVVLRTFVAAAAFAGVALGLVAVATGELGDLLTRSAVSAVIAGYGLWRLRTTATPCR